MKSAARAICVALLVAACGGAAATPQIIYITPPPPSAGPVQEATPSTAPTRRPTTEPTLATHDITVKMAVRGQPFGESGTLLGVGENGCETRGGYSDIGPGMQATIHNPAGDVIGFATFETPGLRTQSMEGPLGLVPTECTFTTLVRDVPEAESYGIEVGSRGTVQFSDDELAAAAWFAELSIGD